MTPKSETPGGPSVAWRTIAALVALVVLAAALGACGGASKSKKCSSSSEALTYRAEPSDPTSVERTVAVLRERAATLGVNVNCIKSAGDRVSITPPDTESEARMRQLTRRGLLFFYDWEANVLGPDGKPSPADANVTGGAAAGQAGAIRFYDAVTRASKRAAQNASGATTDGEYYLVDDKRRKVLQGPAGTQAALVSPLPGGTAPPESRVVKVEAGTIVVCAAKNRRPPGCAPDDDYFVLNDRPALSGKELTNIKQDFQRGTTGAPVVAFDFTEAGRSAWRAVTRRIAQRGQEQQVPGQEPRDAFQHFAAVLDGALLTVPYIDFTQNPDGIDGSRGAEIEGGFTIATAKDLASNLQSGPLPARLVLVSERGS